MYQRAGYVLADTPRDVSGHIEGAVYLVKAEDRQRTEGDRASHMRPL